MQRWTESFYVFRSLPSLPKAPEATTLQSHSGQPVGHDRMATTVQDRRKTKPRPIDRTQSASGLANLFCKAVGTQVFTPDMPFSFNFLCLPSQYRLYLISI